MEQPTMTAKAEQWVNLIARYGDLSEKASYAPYRGDAHGLDNDPAILFALIKGNRERIANLTAAVALLNLIKDDPSYLQGHRELTDYRNACWRFSEWERAVEQFNPEEDTIRGVAEDMVRFKAMQESKKKNLRIVYPHYRADRIALVQGLTREEVIAQATAYLETNKIRYTVSTGAFTYVKGVK